MKELEYFRRRSIGDAQTGCWNWNLGLTRNGYGMAGRGQRLYAHRGAWAAVNGRIPAGMCICHTCDNRRCVNPDHLFLSTQAGNMADMVAKKRQAKGSRNGVSKLTEADVSIIKWCLEAGVAQHKLATMYGLAHGTIGHIARGKTWKHVEPIRYAP